MNQIEEIRSLAMNAVLSVLEIRETESHYMIRMNITETLGDGVEVELNSDELVILGRSDSKAGAASGLILRARPGESKLSAHFRDGFLWISLPKRQKHESRPQHSRLGD